MAHGHGADVLVVDDDAGFRALLTRILEPAGYSVRTATHAHEALQAIVESPPAVAICDIHMPGPTGLWLAEQIREHSPHTAMVLATSDASVPPTESMRRGVVAYILKPYPRHQVLAAVADAYRWWSSQSGEAVPPLVPTAPLSAPPQGPAPRRNHEPQLHARPQAPRRAFPIAKAGTVLAVVAAGVAAYFFLIPGRSSTRVLSQVAASSGMVVVYDGSGTSVMQGSGFFIAPTLFVTNHHVVSGGMSAKVVSGQIGHRVAGVAAADRRHDLVLLETESASPAHLTLAETVPEMGDAIAVYGAPLGLAGTLSTGVVSTANDGTRSHLQITAPISPGSSGSPVVDEAGAVVGVALSSNVLGQGLNFAVPASYVRDLLANRGDVRPLMTASRGVGDDRERHDLIGPVRIATVLPEETLVETLARLTSHYSQTMPPVEARRRAEHEAMAASRTQLTFDREGRLLEVRRGDGSVGTSFTPAEVADAGKTIAHEDLDPTGNPGRRVYADGSESTFRYQLDARGNWISRETTRREHGTTSVRIARRTIEYWE